MIHTRLTSTNLGARALRDVRHIAGLTLAKVDQTDENVESDLRVSGGHVNFCERARQGSKLVDDYPRRAENAAAAATAARTTSTAATTSGQFNENPLAASAKAWTPAT